MLKSNTSFYVFAISREHAENSITTAQLTSSKLIKLLGTYLLVIIAHQQCKRGSADSSEGAGNLALLHRRGRVMSRNRCEPQLLLTSAHLLLLQVLPWEKLQSCKRNSITTLLREIYSLSECLRALLVPGVTVTASPNTQKTNILSRAVKQNSAEGCLSYPSLVCPALCPSAPQGL